MLLMLALLACRNEAGSDPPGPQDGGASVGEDGGSTDGGAITGDAGTPDPDTGTPEDDTGEGSPYILEEEEEAGPLHSLDEVEASLADVFAAVGRADPMTLTSSYEELRTTLGDSSCPYYYTDGDGETYYGYYYWFGGCSASTGTAFSGYGYSYYYEPFTSGSTVYDDYSYTQLFGSITDRFGSEFEMSGYAYHYTYGYTGSNDRYGYAYIQGDARWDDPDAQDTWLAEDLSVDLVWSWSYDADVSMGTALSLSGSISGVPGVMNTALFESVYIYAADAGSSCQQEPSGTISVRDGDGEWYEVEFQGPAWAGAPVFQPHCDGCGTVTWRGEELGSICPDFQPLLDWETRPWD